MSTELADLDFWREFLEIYRDAPALWKVYSEPYKNKHLKLECYNRLTQKLKEIDPEATVEMVKRKINTFRSNYKRECNKVWNSKLKGTPYSPSVWYFKHLEFISEGEPAPEDGDWTVSEESLEVKPVHITDEIFQEESSPTVFYATANPPPPKRFKPSPPDPLASNEENEVIAKYWTNELKYLDVDQKVFAQKAINDILFEARMKTLHRHSVQINRGNDDH